MRSMKRLRVALLILFTMVVAELQAAPSQRLKEKVRAGGTTTVLVRVRLDAPFVPEGRLNANARNAQRERIRRAQERVLRAHSRLPERAMATFESIPHMLVTVDAEGLDALTRDPDVTRIDEEQVLQVTLLDSTSQVEAPYMWDTSGIAATGQGYSVAVLDSGVETSHSFLKHDASTPKLVDEACFSRNSSSWTSLCTSSSAALTFSDAAGSGSPCTGYGVVCEHGTAVAGVAVGKNGSYSGASFNGVAKGANLVAVKIVTLAGSSPVALEGDMIRALLWVDSIRTTASVAAVNISFAVTTGSGVTGWPWAVSESDRAQNCDSGAEDGSNPPPNEGSSHSALYDAVETLRSHGIAVVSGTGNTRENKVGYPACTPNIIAVGAVNKNDGAWSVSSTQGTNSAAAMDLWAPGAGFASGGSGPGLNGILSSIPGNTYAAYPGTSLAAPHVAGAIAVLKQASPTSSIDQIITALKNSGPSITDSLNSVTKRRLDLKRAYYKLVDTSAPSAPVLSVNTTGATSVQVSWSASSDAQSGIDYYSVQRRSTYNSNPATGWTEVARPTSASPITDTVTADTVYQYRVVAVNLAGLSATSNMDVTAMKVFSTDLRILGQHIIDVREAVNRICTFAGTAVCSSTPFPGAYSTQLATLQSETGISATRFTELRSAIDTLRSGIGVSAVTWSTPTPASGVAIAVQYIDEVRNAVD